MGVGEPAAARRAGTVVGVVAPIKVRMTVRTNRLTFEQVTTGHTSEGY